MADTPADENGVADGQGPSPLPQAAPASEPPPPLADPGNAGSENGEPKPPPQIDAAENNLDRAMVRWTGAVAILTGGVAFLTGCLFVAALLQWRSMEGQLRVMRSDESGAAAQLSAAEALESDTQRLASAAADQARVASEQESSMRSMADAQSGQLRELKQSVSAAQNAADAARANADAGRKQLAVMQDAQRAWIKIKPRFDGGLGIMQSDVDAIGLPLNYSLENIGHRPAFHISVQSWMVSSPRNIESILAQKCNALKAPLDSQPGASRVLFPGDSVEDWNKIPIGKITVYAAETTANMMKNADPNGQFQIWIIGCAAYDFGDTSERHHTGFIYRLGYHSDSPAVAPHVIISTFRRNEGIPKDRLELDTGWPINTLMD